MLELASDWKTVVAVASTVVGAISSIPYIREIFRGNTKPHVYTWLVWTLTFGTAVASVWQGGGGDVLVFGLGVNVCLVFIIFLLSLRYGTKDITRGDTISIIAALVAIFVWWGLDNPLLGLLLATGIDLIGYWPTYRKSFSTPWSEDMLSWGGYTLAPALSLVALLEYNVLTVTYSLATLIANLLLIALLLWRRQSVPKPPRQTIASKM
jgi:hypothetical protein